MLVLTASVYRVTVLCTMARHAEGTEYVHVTERAFVTRTGQAPPVSAILNTVKDLMEKLVKKIIQNTENI